MEDLVSLKKFDMKSIPRDSVCCFVAPRNSGKSFLIKDLLYHHQTIPAAVVISKTDKMTHFYDQFIPPVLIYDKYDPDLIDKLLTRQKTALKENWPNPEVLLVFDDTLSDARLWKNDPRIEEIFYNGRHYKIFFLLTMQTPMGIPSGLRGNIDFTFIFQTNNYTHRRNLYENYCGMFPSKEVFDKVLAGCTENYSCLVINNKVKTNNFQEQVFHYKADAHNPFKLCSDILWQMKKKLDASSTPCKDDKKYNVKGNKTMTLRKL